MSNIAISVEQLSKQYVLGLEPAKRHLRDALSDGVRNLFKTGKSAPEESFWALKDVSFEVKEGDRVGIIGRNGAGKSTLLKVLSRITEPSTGRVRMKGRVASLLEVGTGFHPELTGRENVYLNGAILGMSRAEIKQKFDEIVAFSEVEKFLDTPVKRYSSGMYVRLAFAVAAHLEPEVLIVDEVLAVGDIQFQEKCLGKMEDVSASGRTILFVSHNMDSIRKLCSIGIFMKSGMMKEIGGIEEVIGNYLGQFHAEGSSNTIYLDTNSKTGFYVEKIEVLDLNGLPKDQVNTWDAVRFRIHFYSPDNLKSGSVVFQISTVSGLVVTLCSTQPDHSVAVEFKAGMNTVDCVFPKLMVSAGKYLIGAGLAIPNAEWLYRELQYGVLNVAAQDVYHSGFAPVSSRYLTPHDYNWEVTV
jgi:lipopolysaccharide transport system ATP-binding protein